MLLSYDDEWVKAFDAAQLGYAERKVSPWLPTETNLLKSYVEPLLSIKG